MLRKNVAGQFVHIQGVDATTGGIKSGVTWTMRRCLDGTFAAGGATITEDSTNGWYKVALTQADTNGNNIGYNFTGTGAVPQTVNVITTACDPTTATNFGITALPATAVTTNASLLTSGTGTDQLKVTSGNATVNVVQVNGSAAVGQAGYIGVDWGNLTGKTATVALTGTTLSTSILPGIRKNVALANFEILMTDSTNHNPATGLTVAVTRSIDGAAFASGTLGSVTELSNGIYKFDFGAGDLNGTVVTLRATATGADDLFLTIHTDP